MVTDTGAKLLFPDKDIEDYTFSSDRSFMTWAEMAIVPFGNMYLYSYIYDNIIAE